jgi:hypothetical protein
MTDNEIFIRYKFKSVNVDDIGPWTLYLKFYLKSIHGSLRKVGQIITEQFIQTLGQKKSRETDFW